jgi:hypothetical protein
MRANLKNAIQSEAVKYKKQNSSLHSSPSYVRTNDVRTLVLSNSTDIKFNVTQITQTSGQFYEALCNVKGNDYSKKGIS